MLVLDDDLTEAIRLHVTAALAPIAARIEFLRQSAGLPRRENGRPVVGAPNPGAWEGR